MIPLRVFEDCRSRIERARTRRDDLKREWEEFVKSEAYGYRIDIKRDGSGTVYLRIKKPPPQSLSLIIGEMLYQLRASLDGAVYAIAKECGVVTENNERQFQFPVCSCAKNWGDDLHARKIRLLPQKFRDLIERVQPYNRTGVLRPIDRNFAIAILDQWAIIDRHRHLHVIGTRAADFALRVKGLMLTDYNVIKDGLLYDKCELATFRVESRIAGKEPQIEGRIAAAIAVDELPKRTPADDGFLGWVESMITACDDVVNMLEGALTKTS